MSGMGGKRTLHSAHRSVAKRVLVSGEPRVLDPPGVSKLAQSGSRRRAIALNDVLRQTEGPPPRTAKNQPFKTVLKMLVGRTHWPRLAGQCRTRGFDAIP